MYATWRRTRGADRAHPLDRLPVITSARGALVFQELHARCDVMAWTGGRTSTRVDGHQLPLGDSGQPGSAAMFAPLPELKQKVHELLKRVGTRPATSSTWARDSARNAVESVRAWCRWCGKHRP